MRVVLINCCILGVGVFGFEVIFVFFYYRD